MWGFAFLDVSNVIVMLLFFIVTGGIQKRKDKPSNWFSNEPTRENVLMKWIMPGRKFSKLLRYLHASSMANSPSTVEYDPAYKILELRDYLEARYVCLFFSG